MLNVHFSRFIAILNKEKTEEMQ